MTTIDLRRAPRDAFVMHYGGEPTHVNAFTFANSLVAMSEAIRTLNADINPEHKIEIVIDSLGAGSFRAKIKTFHHRLPRLLKPVWNTVILPLLLSIIIENYYDDEPTIIVGDDHYVLEYGEDRIILPKDVYQFKSEVKSRRKVNEDIAKAFEAIETDESIKQFGIARDFDEEVPLIEIPREKFPKLVEMPALDALEIQENMRVTEERVEVVILRAILKRGARKWQFVWRGVPISAPIRDESFFDGMERREYTFGHGDRLDAQMKYVQVRDEDAGVFVNDPNSYEITRVHRVMTSLKQMDLLNGPTKD